MIGRLRGLVVARTAASALLEAGGVGYEIAVTPRDLASLPGLGEEAVLHVHMAVREDKIALFGFGSEQSRDMLRALVGCNGVGPSLAMAILGALTTEEIRRAVATDDIDALTAAPGVGKRKAEKIILELRPKLGALETSSRGGSGLAPVREALEGLGYSPAEIRIALEEASADEPVEEQVRRALQTLGRR